MYAIPMMLQLWVIVAGVLLALVFFVAGLRLKSHADYYLAVRETALNTRKAAEGSQYKGLLVESKICAVLGWIVMVGGPLLAAAAVFVYLANA